MFSSNRRSADPRPRILHVLDNPNQGHTQHSKQYQYQCRPVEVGGKLVIGTSDNPAEDVTIYLSHELGTEVPSGQLMSDGETYSGVAPV